MRPGKAAGNADFTKVLRLGQHTRHAEHKGDLHKLRSLEGKAADLYAHLRPIAGGTDQKDSKEHEYAHHGKNVTIAHQIPDSVYHKRNHQCQYRSTHYDHKLFDGLVHVQTLQHDQSIGNKQAEIVDQKPIHIPIQQAEYGRIADQKGQLRHIQRKHRHFLGIQKNHQMTEKMDQQNDPELPPAERCRILLVRYRKIAEITIGIQHHQKNTDVSTRCRE